MGQGDLVSLSIHGLYMCACVHVLKLLNWTKSWNIKGYSLKVNDWNVYLWLPPKCVIMIIFCFTGSQRTSLRWTAFYTVYHVHVKLLWTGTTICWAFTIPLGSHKLGHVILNVMEGLSKVLRAIIGPDLYLKYIKHNGQKGAKVGWKRIWRLFFFTSRWEQYSRAGNTPQR